MDQSIEAWEGELAIVLGIETFYDLIGTRFISLFLSKLKSNIPECANPCNGLGSNVPLSFGLTLPEPDADPVVRYFLAYR